MTFVDVIQLKTGEERGSKRRNEKRRVTGIHLMFIHVSGWSWLVLKPVDQIGSLFWGGPEPFACLKGGSIAGILKKFGAFPESLCAIYTLQMLVRDIKKVLCQGFQFNRKLRWKMMEEPWRTHQTDNKPSCNSQLCQTFHGRPAFLAEDLEGFEVPPLPRSDPSRYQGSAWLVHSWRTCPSKKLAGSRDGYKGEVEINPHFQTLLSENVCPGIGTAVNDLANAHSKRIQKSWDKHWPTEILVCFLPIPTTYFLPQNLKWWPGKGLGVSVRQGANVLSTKTGTIKLADFGVATKLSEIDSSKRRVVGTPYWMAPETVETLGSRCVGVFLMFCARDEILLCLFCLFS